MSEECVCEWDEDGNWRRSTVPECPLHGRQRPLSDALRAELRVLNSRLVTLSEQVREKQAEAARLRSQYKEIIAQAVGLEARRISLGAFECETSPTGRCIYDDWGDPMHDRCLYCDDPSERK